MEKLILLFALTLMFFISGNMEGYWKQHKTANHWLSVVQTLLLMISIWIVSRFMLMDWYNILAIPFLRKMPFDYGYMICAKSKKLTGNTSWDDKIVTYLQNKFGAKFPVDLFILFILYFVGVSLLML